MNSTLSGIFIGAGIVIVLLLLLAAALFVGLRLGRARNASEVTGRIPAQDFSGVPAAPAQRNGHRVEQLPAPTSHYSDGQVPYPDLDSKYQLVGPPTVGNFTLKNWLVQVSGREGIWRDVVEEFYSRAAGHPVVGRYFVGVNMDRLKRHFLQALLMVTDKGLTVGTARRMYEAHLMVSDTGGNAITEEVYDAVVATLGSVLAERGVSRELIGQTVAVLDPLRELLIQGETHTAGAR
jgi:truncated hemoglobin YjbI